MGPFVAQVIQLSHKNGLDTMVTKLNPCESKADWCRFCIHLRSLNLRHFKMVEYSHAYSSPEVSQLTGIHCIITHTLCVTLSFTCIHKLHPSIDI
jgi:hypothetical protein